MKMNSKDFILVLNLCPCTAPLDGSLCILTSFKEIVHSIFKKKKRKRRNKNILARPLTQLVLLLFPEWCGSGR